MAFLQPNLSLKVSQRQVLTPGLVQMVSVLALNKLELKDMITAEIVENPLLEEVEENDVALEPVAEREAAETVATETAVEKDPFDEIDFGSYFQDYLDPGFRSPDSFENSERPAFESMLSQTSTLTDHLTWQIGALALSPEIRAAADLIIGNLNEDGYLTATEQELIQALVSVSSGSAGVDPEEAATILSAAMAVVRQLDPPGVAARDLRECLCAQIDALLSLEDSDHVGVNTAVELISEPIMSDADATDRFEADEVSFGEVPFDGFLAAAGEDLPSNSQDHSEFADVKPSDARAFVSPDANGAVSGRVAVLMDARRIVLTCLSLLQKKDMRELSRVLRRPIDAAQLAVDLIRTLDPKPGRRYNREEARLIEPDVAFVKRDDEYIVVMNEEDLPVLRLNQGYRRLLSQVDTARDVKSYVKERYKSAIQLIRNIEQRKNTILRTCDAIVRRQQEFLEKGIDCLRPMMIKDVAEEIGVHPSTVSRAVSNKYVHTPQGVFELRYFFSEAAAGSEGSTTPLMLLKRKVKKLIDAEDSQRPMTDDQLALALQQQGIQVTRRTVAKYREELHIPSTHQRRVRQ